ncbi:MAG: class I SAM-dependent methyltransferase, partial [Planctomycetota bacterium]
LDLYYRRDDAAAKGEAAFAFKALGLRAGARSLDVACGAGRHARAMAELGARVVAVDLSRELLELAAGVPRARADMRALPFSGAFDAATSFFTSFGYFDDGGNRRALSAVAGALLPGGSFLLDFLNAVAVSARLVPESEEERAGKRFRIRRRIEDGRVRKEVTVEEDGGKRRYVEDVRLYLHQELLELLRDAGLNPIAAYGDFLGGDYTTDSPRCILVARKP